MLRSLVVASILGFSAIVAGAEEAPARGMEVRSDTDGQLQGRVGDVTRDAQGRIVSVAMQGLAAPAGAPPYLMAPRRPAAPVVAASDGFRIAQNSERPAPFRRSR